MAEPHGGFPKLLESHIVRQTTWENLPQQAKQLVNNSRDSWDEAVVQYSLRHQLRWRTSLVKSIRTDERAYYEELIRTSRTQLMVLDALSIACSRGQTDHTHIDNDARTRTHTHTHAAVSVPLVRRADQGSAHHALPLLLRHDERGHASRTLLRCAAQLHGHRWRSLAWNRAQPVH